MHCPPPLAHSAGALPHHELAHMLPPYMPLACAYIPPYTPVPPPSQHSASRLYVPHPPPTCAPMADADTRLVRTSIPLTSRSSRMLYTSASVRPLRPILGSLHSCMHTCSCPCPLRAFHMLPSSVVQRGGSAALALSTLPVDSGGDQIL
jgi:hypothetical protein